jgi:hypothetical protein
MHIHGKTKFHPKLPATEAAAEVNLTGETEERNYTNFVGYTARLGGGASGSGG